MTNSNQPRSTFQFSLKGLMKWMLVWTVYLGLMRSTGASVSVTVVLGVYWAVLVVLAIEWRPLGVSEFTAGEWTGLVMTPVREAFGHKLHWFLPGQKKLTRTQPVHLGIGTATFAMMHSIGFVGHDCEARTAQVAVRFSQRVRPAWGESAWKAIEVVSLDGQPQARIVAGCFDDSPPTFPRGRRYGIVPASRWFFEKSTGLACCQSVNPLLRFLGSLFTSRSCLVDEKGRVLFRTHFSHIPSVVMEEAALNSADLDVLLLVASYFARRKYQRPFAFDVAPAHRSEG